MILLLRRFSPRLWLPSPSMVSKNCALAGFLAPESFAKCSLTIFLLQLILGAQGEALERVQGGMPPIASLPHHLWSDRLWEKNRPQPICKKRAPFHFPGLQLVCGRPREWPASLGVRRGWRLRTHWLPASAAPWPAFAEGPRPEQIWFRAVPVTLLNHLVIQQIKS